MTNCPNCGAPYEYGKVKCSYCGTQYDIPKNDFTISEVKSIKLIKMSTNAVVAQRQCNCLVSNRLWVRFPLAAPATLLVQSACNKK